MTTSNDPGGSDTNTLPIGFALAEFRIEQVIGEGGFGIVYLALDTQLGRKVAIKEYMPSSLAARKNDLSVTVTSPRHRETFDLGLRSFVKEAITLARFDHPALLKVFRFWEERGTAYMVMPYLEGQTLKQALRARPDAPPEAWLRALLEPVLDGLEHLHANNILHRDIAPDNIQILPSGVPLLLDFGAARQVIGDATQALTVILKPGFAPIEQYSDSATLRQGAWTDVYALAAVCYDAISGKTPQASVARVMHDEMPSAASIGAERYSPEFLAFIDACLRVRPQDRPQSIAEARRVMLGLAPPPAVAAPAEREIDDDRTVIRPSARTQAPTTSRAAATIAPTAAPPITIAAPPSARTQTTATASPAPTSARSRTGAYAIGAAAAVGVVLAAWKFWPTTAPAPAPIAAAPTRAAASKPVPEPAASAAAPRQPAPTTAAAAIDQLIAGQSAAVQVSSQPAQSELAIARDALQFNVRSSSAGHVYVLIANAATNQLTLLFPNALDQDNQIAAGTELSLPRAAWKTAAQAPAGTRSILTVVSAMPRDLQAAGWKRDGPYASYALGADLASTSAGPAVLGAPICATSAACSAAYGMAQFDLNVVVAAPVVAEAERRPSAPPKRPAAAEDARATKPASNNAQQCAALLVQASMGQDTPEIARKMAELHCR